MPLIHCALPPHEPLAFASLAAYEVHYNQTHTNRCAECQRNFPDTHFLHLHIAENHDPINAARRDRGEQTYACLLPSCDRLCSTAPKRRMHCIDKHHYPRNFDFFVINDGIDRRTSLLRPQRRRSSTMTSGSSTSSRQRTDSMSIAVDADDQMDLVQDEKKVETAKTAIVANRQESSTPRRATFRLRGRGGFSHPQKSDRAQDKTTSSDPMDTLTSHMSSLQFVPHSVRMARGRGRGRGRGTVAYQSN